VRNKERGNEEIAMRGGIPGEGAPEIPPKCLINPYKDSSLQTCKRQAYRLSPQVPFLLTGALQGNPSREPLAQVSPDPANRPGETFSYIPPPLQYREDQGWPAPETRTPVEPREVGSSLFPFSLPPPSLDNWEGRGGEGRGGLRGRHWLSPPPP
jgi:hypothetical protein